MDGERKGNEREREGKGIEWGKDGEWKDGLNGRMGLKGRRKGEEAGEEMEEN